jgi:virulence-associated protein VapD
MGEKSKNAVDCVLAVLEISKELPWFYSSVKQIRMLRITSDDDLMPVILGAVAKDD